MTDDPDKGEGSCTSRPDTEEMRDDMNRIITNYPSLTVCQTLGVLELLKAELIERLRTSGPKTDR
jgi:hypothetical protein